MNIPCEAFLMFDCYGNSLLLLQGYKTGGEPTAGVSSDIYIHQNVISYTIEI